MEKKKRMFKCISLRGAKKNHWNTCFRIGKAYEFCKSDNTDGGLDLCLYGKNNEEVWCDSNCFKEVTS